MKIIKDSYWILVILNEYQTVYIYQNGSVGIDLAGGRGVISIEDFEEITKLRTEYLKET